MLSLELADRLSGCGATVVSEQYRIVVNKEPQALPEDCKRWLAEEIARIVGITFSPVAKTDEVIATAMGLPNRNKILATTFDKSEKLVSFIAGQILNDEGAPHPFNGDYVFHLSTGHSLSGNILRSVKFLYEEVSKNLVRPTYLSGFTQNPRVYEFFSKFTRIYPSLTGDTEALATHRLVSEFLGHPDEVVFKHKTHASYYIDRPNSRSQVLDDWWYNELGVVPENGDLVLIVGKINESSH